MQPLLYWLFVILISSGHHSKYFLWTILILLLKGLKFKVNNFFIKWSILIYKKTSNSRSTFVFFNQMVKPYFLEILEFEVNFCFKSNSQSLFVKKPQVFGKLLVIYQMVEPYFLESLNFEVNFCFWFHGQTLLVWKPQIWGQLMFFIEW